MALTDNPYLPLFVRDWLTSNKLKMCSSCAQGVLINVMCVLHRENEYGKILLKQKFKQTLQQNSEQPLQQNIQQIKNFARMFAKLCSLDIEELESGLIELVSEKALTIEGDYLINERMVKDAKLSKERALNGSKGGKSTSKKKGKFGKALAKNFAVAKVQANTENEIEINNETVLENKEDKKNNFEVLDIDGIDKKLASLPKKLIDNAQDIDNHKHGIVDLSEEYENIATEYEIEMDAICTKTELLVYINTPFENRPAQFKDFNTKEIYEKYQSFCKLFIFNFPNVLRSKCLVTFKQFKESLVNYDHKTLEQATESVSGAGEHVHPNTLMITRIKKHIGIVQNDQNGNKGNKGSNSREDFN